MSPYLALIKLRIMGSNGTPKPDEREYPDEYLQSFSYYAVSKNDNDLDTKEIDNSKVKDNFEADEPIFGGQLEI